MNDNEHISFCYGYVLACVSILGIYAISGSADYFTPLIAAGLMAAYAIVKYYWWWL